MNDPVQELGDRLLECEPTDAALAERYRREVSAMLYRGTGVRPKVQIACGVFIVALGLACAAVIWRAGEEALPAWMRWVTSLGGLYMVFAGVTAVVCAIRRVDPRRYRAMWFGLGMLFLVTMGASFLLAGWKAEEARLGWQLTEVAFVLLGFAGITTVLHFMEDFYKRTELRLLDLEYRLADLAAKTRRP